MDDPFAPFQATVQAAIRPCREADLPALEWWGLFTAHRDLIHRVFARQERGQATLMLVVEVNGMAAGQAWIDLSRHAAERLGVIWALRVFPCLQGCGIGGRLLGAAEEVLRERGCAWAEVTVDKEDDGSRRLYERRGYRRVDLPPAAMASLAPPDSPPPAPGSQWVLRKLLQPGTA